MAIEFTNKPIKWTNKGTAPSEDLKTNGFQAGYKPPAALFNNQWHVTGECIDELQDKLSEENTARNTHENNKSNPHSVTKAQVGLGNVDNTSDANKPISTATQAALNAMPIKSLAGQSVSPTYGTTVTAETGATIVGDKRDRTYNSSNGFVISGNVASGQYSTSMGSQTTASGGWSTAMGYNTTASGLYSIAMGSQTTASGQYSTSMGSQTTASGGWSTAMGYNTTASGQYSTAMGSGTVAFNYSSVAMGNECTANGTASFAMGDGNTASGHYSTAIGCKNTSLASQFKCGHWANDGTAADTSGTTGDAFIIGNGTGDDARSNCFRVTYSGNVYGLSSFKATGADYAEYFEWKDGNPDNEDRRGRLVTLDGDKIRFATAEDTYILGVISAAPCVEGDVYSDDWQGKYLTDVFGQRLTQTVHIPARYEEIQTIDPETGEIVTENILVEDEHDSVQWILNPEYDPEKEYVSREDRKEWSAIGLMGKLVVIDDGTCEVNGYCKAGVNGIATKADDGYRVMARIDDTHIRVLVR